MGRMTECDRNRGAKNIMNWNKAKRKMTIEEIATMIDISAVRAESTWDEIENILAAAGKYPFICLFSMPGMIDRIKGRMGEIPATKLGGIVGFPSGGETAEAKLFEAVQLKEKGCDEIDMVMNIGKLKSGMFDEVKAEIREIRAAIAPLPLKVIMEAALLTDREIDAAARIIRDAGASFVKTGTGWAGPTTEHHIEIIKNAVGDSIPLKVAGGVRSLDVLLRMRAMGVSRFGIGYKSALRIMEEAERKDGVWTEPK